MSTHWQADQRIQVRGQQILAAKTRDGGLPDLTDIEKIVDQAKIRIVAGLSFAEAQ